MKRILALVLLLAQLCACCCVLAEEHTHIWGEWVPAEGGHTAACIEDGETLTVKHYTFSTRLGGFSDTVCAMCGQYSGGVFTRIE